MNEPDLDTLRLDLHDIVYRANRARGVLLGAIEAVTDDAFLRDPGDGWSCAVALRHVVWVEHHWTLKLRDLCRAEPGEVVAFGPDSGPRAAEIAAEASRLAGVPDYAGELLPPFAGAAQAVASLESSRAAFLTTVEALTPRNLDVRLLEARSPAGAVSCRWIPEHVIEHDWDHAVQIARLGA